jgi:Ran GTPase-activating protein (RanGAP) involved in mRNA processing and transport
MLLPLLLPPLLPLPPLLLLLLQSREAPIKVLDIGNNSLTPAAADALARLLHSKCEKLTDLNMYMNEVGDSGMKLLAPALKECK